MVFRKILFQSLLFFCTVQVACDVSLLQHFQRAGYVEILNNYHNAEAFDSLYVLFDEMIEFLQSNPFWTHKLNSAKERFIRSKNRHLYRTDFFGLYDESNRKDRNQVAFYYSIHFHEFILTYLPEINRIPSIINFLHACLDMQKPYGTLIENAALELNLSSIFSSECGSPPILLKVVKYLPAYNASRPHYDGSAFSLFLDSTDNQSLLLSPYKSSFSSNDFYCPLRNFPRKSIQNSLLLIPGALLTEYSIYPTPHIVIKSGKTRYATIAFAMRPHYTPLKNDFSPLPVISIE